MTPTSITDLPAYLHALHARESRSAWLDIRVLPTDGGPVRRRFVSHHRLDTAAEHIAAAASAADVFLGAAARVRPRGDRHAVERAWALWADCDDEAAAERLADATVAPSLVVRSGSPHAVHAYWSLDRPVTRAVLEWANRRLAHALGADPRSTDAARMLRPPGTWNHKSAPPAPVALAALTGDAYALADVVGGLPDPPPSRATPLARRKQRVDVSDPLHTIPPTTYVGQILGVTVPRSRKIVCPFHDDRVPSLHVYPEAHRGWVCFGCRRGGSIYDLAAAAWGLNTRGAAFVELRARLLALFGLAGVRAA